MSKVHRAVMLLSALLVLFALLFAFGCENKQTTPPQKEKIFTHYTEIPGVTKEEIKAVEEAFRARGTKPFIYGRVISSGLFYNASGQLAGSATLFCDWLSKLFNHAFEPKQLKWGDLLHGLKTYTVDFSGEISPTKENQKKYMMTDVIVTRVIKCLRITGSRPLPEIAKQRPLRYVFMQDSAIQDTIAPHLTEKYFPIYASDHETAYKLLKSGKADAFFDDDTNEATLTLYADIESKKFFPLAYEQMSVATQNPELAPFISIIQKALRNGAAQQVSRMFDDGIRAYNKHQFWQRLTEEEKAYIVAHDINVRSIPFAAGYDNYPNSFYNTEEKLWQGVAFDVLHEVSMLTGLTFERISKVYEKWHETLAKLENGEAALITELIPTKEREGRFLWADTPFTSDLYALLSKDTFHNVTDNEILHLKIGLTTNTAHTEAFKNWFPNHPNTVEFESLEDAFEALDHGKIDLLMATQNLLLTETNFKEQPGFKANFIFDQTYASMLGFNKKEILLTSIINKALHNIDTKAISERWIRKTFNYRDKMLTTQRKWIIAASALLLCILVLTTLLLRKNKKEGERLQSLVARQTKTLSEQLTIITEAEERAKAMLDMAPLICGFWDDKSNCIDCNVEALKAFGLEKTSDYTNHWLELNPEIQPDGTPTREKAAKLIAETLSNGRTDFEWMYLTKNGEPLPVETTLIRVNWKDGMRVLAYSRDLREIKNYGERLNRLSALIHASPQFSLSMTTEGKVEYVNQAVVDISGYACQEIMDNGLSVMLDKRNTQRIYKEYLPKAAKGKRSTTEFAIIQKDGGKRVLHCSIFPVKLNESHISVGISALDVTELRRVQLELIDAKQQAENALKTEEQFAKAKNDFFSMISHEIRTPLNAIFGMASMLRTAGEHEKKQCIDTIDKSSHELLGIFDSIINMTQLQSGSFDLNNKEFDLHKTLHELTAITEAHTRQKQHTFTVTLGDNLPDQVVGDPARLLLVLKHLVDNAIKFTPDGGIITVSSRIIHETDKFWSLCFEIRDNGIGLSQEMQERLWQPFEQDNSNMTRRYGGIGLGLALSRQIARKMGGDIFLESRLGAGSIILYTVTLGKPKVAIGNIVAVANALEVLRQKRIMIVDDVELNRLVIAGYLSGTDVSIENASDGYEAIEKFCRTGGGFDLILMDLHMLEMDGYETARRIRASGVDNSTSVPIIAVTADMNAEKNVLGAGMDGFITKPVNCNVLLEIMARQLAAR